MKRGHQNFSPIPPYSIPFLSVLYQNKALYNFGKREERSIVERNIVLEYPLPSVINKVLRFGN